MTSRNLRDGPVSTTGLLSRFGSPMSGSAVCIQHPFATPGYASDGIALRSSTQDLRGLVSQLSSSSRPDVCGGRGVRGLRRCVNVGVSVGFTFTTDIKATRKPASKPFANTSLLLSAVTVAFLQQPPQPVGLHIVCSSLGIVSELVRTIAAATSSAVVRSVSKANRRHAAPRSIRQNSCRTP